eukprot:TRINITY_DN18929_c0_g1_i1.p1 TRINITY_DN18929_c0_g1~~TRINITY_DN18929_c0_g1_i1.p1  ORF type:complete len:244 (+),score=65.11 TRINITY_DN18929_c0_g1_i1:72-734(+)
MAALSSPYTGAAAEMHFASAGINDRCRAERESLRRAGEAEAKMRAAVEQQRRALAQQRAELEERLAAAEADLERRKELARQLQESATMHDGSVGSNERLEEIWREVEATAAEVRAVGEKLGTTRRSEGELSEKEQARLEAARCLHGLYLGMTGIRWEQAASGEGDERSPAAGYVALATAKRFEVAGKSSPVESAEAIWNTIEECLPPRTVSFQRAPRPEA